MNHRKSLSILLLVLFGVLNVHAADIPRRSPQEISDLVNQGKAVLVDVREKAEWKETGVAEPAVLLSLSDLLGDRTHWKAFLEQNRDKEIILACRSGNRSGQAATILAREGFKTSNGGGFRDWVAAGLPTRKVK